MRSFSPRLAWCLSRSGEPDTTTAGSLQAHSRTDPYDAAVLQDLRIRAAWEGIPRFPERGKRHHRGVSANDSINRATAWPASSTHVWMLTCSGTASTLLPFITHGPGVVVAGVSLLTLCPSQAEARRPEQGADGRRRGRSVPVDTRWLHDLA